jgi:hypothetical protein
MFALLSFYPSPFQKEKRARKNVSLCPSWKTEKGEFSGLGLNSFIGRKPCHLRVFSAEKRGDMGSLEVKFTPLGSNPGRSTIVWTKRDTSAVIFVS